MENTKRCPINLDGYLHYCPDDPGQHDSLEKIQAYLERKFSFSPIEPQNDIDREHRRTLEFIRSGCKGVRPKPIETSKPETIPPTISASQQQALIDIKKYKSGERINMQCHASQAEIREPEPERVLSFEEKLIEDWKTQPGLQKEFVSFNSYRAFQEAEARGKTKIIGGRVLSHKT